MDFLAKETCGLGMALPSQRHVCLQVLMRLGKEGLELGDRLGKKRFDKLNDCFGHCSVFYLDYLVLT